jgi:hypothetical protein
LLFLPRTPAKKKRKIKSDPSEGYAQVPRMAALLGYENGVGPGNLGSNLNVIFEEAMFLHDIQYFKQNS